MEPPVVREHVAVPVTALEFFTDSCGEIYLLSGEDTQLNVYNVASSELCVQLRVFAEQPIHGIHLSGESVLIWGSRSVATLSRDSIETALSPRQGSPRSLPQVVESQAPDWIYGGAISPYDGSRAVLVTAHNEALPISWSSRSPGIKFGLPVSLSRPILYTAHLVWTSPDCILIAGGTVFGEILVWKYHAGRGGESACEPLFCLTGHEGSIFGTDISDEISIGGGPPVRLLVSCSDDRTIRVWDITECHQSDKRILSSNGEVAVARETGFGPNGDVNALGHENHEPIAMAMGHLSRIWQVKFPKGPLLEPGLGKPFIPIYSFGEDSTVHRWILEPEKQQDQEVIAMSARHQTPSSLTCLNLEYTISNHEGRNIWSTAMTVDQAGRLLVATGGADGKIALNEEAQTHLAKGVTPGVTQKPADRLDILNLSDILKSLPSTDTISPHSSVSRDVVSRYAFITDDLLLGSTRSGVLLTATLDTLDGEPQWAEVPIPPQWMSDIGTCSGITPIGHGFAILRTVPGNLYLYKTPCTVTPITTLLTKPIDIMALSLDTSSPETPLAKILVVLQGSLKIQVLTLDLAAGAIQSNVTVEGTPDRFLVTSAAFVRNYLILGSRFGAISILEPQGATYVAAQTLENQSPDAVTSITPLQHDNSSDSALFLTTHRDGRYRIYGASQVNGQVIAQLHHQIAPPVGPIIEGAFFVEGAQGVPELLLCGFKGPNVVMWNETRREFQAVVNCGGAHREFAFAPSKHLNVTRFAFSRATKLHIYSQTRPSRRLLKSGVHPREIRSLSVHGSYLATAAEDTSVRVWKLEEGSVRCLAVMRMHSSSVKCVKWAGSKYILSSGGLEDLIVWNVQELHGLQGVALHPEGRLPQQTSDGDLRILSFDVREGAETGKEGGLFVVVGLSNSVLKAFSYSLETEFQTIAETLYTGACITQVQILERSSICTVVLTASTDGHLVIWTLQPSGKDGRPEFKLELIAQVHQSTIQSLDISTSTEGGKTTYCVYTVGDDNALARTTIARDREKNQFTTEGRCIVRKAHAAAATGVAVSPGKGNSPPHIITTGNDQRVKVWKFRDGASTVGASLVSDEYSGVADAGDVQVFGDGKRFVLGGVGMELWRMSL